MLPVKYRQLEIYNLSEIYEEEIVTSSNKTTITHCVITLTKCREIYYITIMPCAFAPSPEMDTSRGGGVVACTNPSGPRGVLCRLPLHPPRSVHLRGRCRPPSIPQNINLKPDITPVVAVACCVSCFCCVFFLCVCSCYVVISQNKNLTKTKKTKQKKTKKENFKRNESKHENKKDTKQKHNTKIPRHQKFVCNGLWVVC